jgi:hypothetical protein
MKTNKKFNVVIDSDIFSCDVNIEENKVLPFIKNTIGNIRSRHGRMQISRDPGIIDLRPSKKMVLIYAKKYASERPNLIKCKIKPV